MKKMIPNILFNSICFLAFLFIRTLPLHASSNEVSFIIKLNSDNDLTMILNESELYTCENQTVALDTNRKYVMVLKNSKNCSECFKSLDNYFSHLKSNSGIQFILITLIDSTALDRKRNLLANKKLMPFMNDNYFQFNNSRNITLFNKLKTKYTPEIILVDKGMVTHIPYPEIFEFPSLEISSYTQNKIDKLINMK